MSRRRAGLAGLVVVIAVGVLALSVLRPDPPTPAGVLADFNRVSPLLDAHLDDWGGAYVEGGHLIVKYVHQTRDQAKAAMRNVGATQNVQLVESTVSLADLDRAVSALDGESLHRAFGVTGWGPDFATSALVVEAAHPSSVLQIAIEKSIGSSPVRVILEKAHGTPVAN